MSYGVPGVINILKMFLIFNAQIISTPYIYLFLEPEMPVIAKTIILLTVSNIFMTFAWYSHLKNLSGTAWYVAAFASWGIALFEYLVQVPANRLGYTELSLPQLKILQEVITLSVFVPFALVYMKESIRLNYLWAGLCLMGAVYFIFKG